VIIAYVRWSDAAYTPNEIKPENAASPCEMETVGALVRTTPDEIVLALDTCSEHGIVRHVQTIPKCCVLEIRMGEKATLTAQRMRRRAPKKRKATAKGKGEPNDGA
jgi:hypothetical protein